jgi:hypothetical protein
MTNPLTTSFSMNNSFDNDKLVYVSSHSSLQTILIDSDPDEPYDSKDSDELMSADELADEFVKELEGKHISFIKKVYLYLVLQIIFGFCLVYLSNIMNTLIHETYYEYIQMVLYGITYMTFVFILLFENLANKFPLNYILFFSMNLLGDISINFFLKKFIDERNSYDNISYIILISFLTMVTTILLIYNAPKLPPKIKSYRLLVKVELLVLFMLEFINIAVCDYIFNNEIVCELFNVTIGIFGVFFTILYTIIISQMVLLSTYYHPHPSNTYKPDEYMMASLNSYLGILCMYAFVFTML